MKKYKKFLFSSTQKKNAHHKCGPVHGARRARKVNPILNCRAGQPDPHFVGQNAGWVKTGRAGPLYHP